MDEKERHRLKQELRRGLSELRNRFDELHKDLEWAEMTECYPKASAVYRMIERLEEIYKENIIRLLTTIIHHRRTRAVPVMDDIQEILI